MQSMFNPNPTSTTFTSREFCHKASSAKRAADFGPVFITDRGQTKYVLIGVSEYQKLNKQTASLANLLACDDDLDFEQHLPRFGELAGEADFS